MRVLRIKAVLEKTGLGKTTLYKLIGIGSFPSPIPLGERIVGWLESEVDNWIAACLSKRTQISENISQSN